MLARGLSHVAVHATLNSLAHPGSPWPCVSRIPTTLGRLREIRPFVSILHANYKEARKSRPKKRQRSWEAGDGGGGFFGESEEERTPSGEGMAADLLRRSGRDLSKADPSETKLLREAMDELRSCWAGKEPSGEWEMLRDASAVL